MRRAASPRPAALRQEARGAREKAWERCFRVGVSFCRGDAWSWGWGGVFGVFWEVSFSPFSSFLVYNVFFYSFSLVLSSAYFFSLSVSFSLLFPLARSLPSSLFLSLLYLCLSFSVSPFPFLLLFLVGVCVIASFVAAAKTESRK